MRVYAGIDEAGYGPMFGPMVIARSVFTVDEAFDADPPCLWKRLSKGVCRQARDRRKRIAVDDSKKLNTPAAGIAHLERGVLGFAHLLGHAPADLTAWLQAVGLDDESRAGRLPWYADPEPDVTLPQCLTDGECAIDRGRLARAAESAGVGMADLRAAVVFEDRFNRMVAATRSKARCSWTFVAAHLWAIWQDHGTRRPWVVVDRQGGRTQYLQPLQMLFDGAALRQTQQDETVNRYVIEDGDRSMTVSFETASEDRHLPAALASMTAKYTRELLMTRFNRFWARHDPDLKPTKGYTQDGRRFLRDIDPLIDRLAIDRETLIRCR